MKIPVLIPNIFNHPFTYDTNLKLKVGDYVKAPFGKSEITGIVWNEFEEENKKKFKIKNINTKLEIEPLKIETIKLNLGRSDNPDNTILVCPLPIFQTTSKFIF